MRGTHTLHSTIKRLLTITVMAASFGNFASPASAHEPSNYLDARQHIKERAMSQMGKPYRYAQESPRRGFDCSGLTYWTFKNHGDTLPRSSIDQWGLRKVDRYKRVFRKDHLQIGDLVFFKTSGAAVGHVGIYIGGRDRFVHSTPSRRGVSTDTLRDRSYWKPRYVGAVRVPALQNPGK